MSPIPLSSAVVAILTPVAEMSCSPVHPASYMTQGELAKCERDSIYLDCLEYIAKEADDALLGINMFILKQNRFLVHKYYVKFCDSIEAFFCNSSAIMTQLKRMLYVSWENLKSLCSLFVHVKKGIEGTLKFIIDTEDEIWEKAGMLMHGILGHVYEKLRSLECVIKAEAAPGDGDLKCLQEEFADRAACCRHELQGLFYTRWQTNRLLLSDQDNLLSIRELILAGKPKDNILVDIDPEGYMPSDMMTLHIFNNRMRITDKTVNDYFIYRAKWELLHGHMDSLKIEHRKVSDMKMKRGRPRATDKSLSDYVCRGVDANALHQEIMHHLSVNQGKADVLAVMLKHLIDGNKLCDVVPYDLMKKEFGELIQCACQNFNRSVNALELRKKK